MIQRVSMILLSVLLLGCGVLSVALAQDCSNDPINLTVGGTGTVTHSDGKPLNVRDTPNRSGKIVGQLPEGSTFRVMDNPVCAGSIWWWKIEASGLTGWVAEGTDDLVYVAPLLDVAARLDPAAVLVYSTSSGLVLAAPDRTVLHTFDGMQPTQYHFSDHEFFFEDGISLTAIATDGSQRTIALQQIPGGLADFFPAPDGHQIAWLFVVETDVTSTAGNPCGDGIRCYDRDYTLIVSNGSGAQAHTIWTKHIEDRNNGLYLSLLGWDDRADAVFVVRNPQTPSGDYPVMGDAIFEVSISGTDTKTLLDNYLGITALAVSPDGHWTAHDGASVGGYLPLIESDTGGMYAVTQAAYTDNVQVTVSSQYTFSPNTLIFAWAEVSFDKTNLSAATTSIRELDMTDGSIGTLASFRQSSPPTLPAAGQWLTNRLLVWNYDEATYVYDMSSGENIDWGLDNGLSVLLGKISP